MLPLTAATRSAVAPRYRYNNCCHPSLIGASIKLVYTIVAVNFAVGKFSRYSQMKTANIKRAKYFSTARYDSYCPSCSWVYAHTVAQLLRCRRDSHAYTARSLTRRPSAQSHVSIVSYYERAEIYFFHNQRKFPSAKYLCIT